MVSIDPAGATALQNDNTQRANSFYRAAWRWHFYAGVYVIPFFIMLALTGLVMLWIAFIGGRDGERIAVTPQDAPLALSDQAAAAQASIEGGILVQYVAPRADDLAAIFRVDAHDVATMVAVDPYTAEVLASFPRRSGWYDMADNIHANLLLGVTGDRMIEIAASLGMVLIATGLYLWWPRGTGLRAALLPRLGRGRALWKSLHGAIGLWVSVVLIFFLISGLSWAGIWGEKIVQAWSQFPAEKWEAPLSDDIHADMNHGPKEVPWALEQTPMPASGSDAGVAGLAEGMPATLDSIDALARQIGFDARYQMNLPRGEDGVWTLSRDSMNTDAEDPTSDRTVHIDRHTGKILADVRYADYSLAGKAMAVGIALHMGTLGWPSVVANTLFCLSVIFLCVSGVVMWWKRRPANPAGWLSAPPAPRNMTLWKGAVVVGLAVALAFPMAGVTLLVVGLLDWLLLRRVPALKRMVS
ncbi:PepSY-associated TM helix domain-containing protein [Sulfitobacter sp. 1A12157]|uniref:PepSY-associated TM helix domain-containing protein n=1 Tax=Sulfitobacter sp. 1A12157 TaxID=3368594 RepID=UPI0037465409